MTMPTGDPWNIDTGGDTTGAGDWQFVTIRGVPYSFNKKTGALLPYPSGYEPTGEGLNIGGLQGWMKNLFGNITSGQAPGAMPSLMAPTKTGVYDWPSTATGGGPSYMQYDPFSQQLQAAQLQESIRQANLSAGYNRSTLLNDVLSNPANVFSSWFQARGQVPPYNAQLANILNIPGGGNPWFGAMPPLGETPGIPGIPQPQVPQAIPVAAKGGTFIPAEPAVAIGLTSGQPLFTFNENAPQQTEKVQITPQQMSGAPNRYPPSFQYGGTALPAPIQDFYDRGGPQFPWMTQLGQGNGLQYPDISQALHGMPTPSLQSLNRMLPSEQQGLFSMFNTLFGVSPEDVVTAARIPFNNLRSATPALQRIQ